MRRAAGLVVVAGLALVGCGGGADDASETSRDQRTLRVFAASSLTEAFTELGATFDEERPGVEVTFNFAASSSLAQQLVEGAPADVFVSADEPNMQRVVDAGRAADPKVIARNRLSIVVEPGNPKGIDALADLAAPGIVTVLCAPEVPCGRYAAALLAKADVQVTAASLEENVKGVVAKVTLGEADAGIVYVTDVQAAGARVQGVTIDRAADRALEAVYPMAVTDDAAEPGDAAAWADFVASDAGQRVLTSYGFLAP